MIFGAWSMAVLLRHAAHIITLLLNAAMTSFSHVLILLTLCYCEANEFYVVPTEPANTSCPGYPCLTLNQYTKNSESYFKSNTVFTFLPGIHPMERPLHIQSVQNVLLKTYEDVENGLSPQLRIQFACENDKYTTDAGSYDRHICFGAIELDNVTKATVSGLHVSVSLNETNIHKGVVGILVRNSQMIAIHSVLCSNAMYGIVLENTNCTTISDIITAKSYRNGLILYASNTTFISNTFSVNNSAYGMYSTGSQNLHVLNSTFAYNYREGVLLYDTSNVHIAQSTSEHNEGLGIVLTATRNISITDSFLSQNKKGGTLFYKTVCSRIINSESARNLDFGINLNLAINSSIISSIFEYNSKNGLFLVDSTNTEIVNSTSLHSYYNGIVIHNSSNTFIMRSNFLRSRGNGIHVYNTSVFRLMNSTVMHSVYIGLVMATSSDCYVNNTIVTHNRVTGTAIDNSIDIFITNMTSTVTFFNSKRMVIHNSVFNNFNSESSYSSTDPTDLPAVIVLYYTTLQISECTFEANDISSVKAFSSNISISGTTRFSNNKALAGTAFVLAKDSIITLMENSYLHLINNHATNHGGVFYIINEEFFLAGDLLNENGAIHNAPVFYPQTTCFLNVKGSRLHTRLTFVNNTAGKGGDILYGGLVALGWDSDWNCLNSFKNSSNISQTSLSLISSAPYRVCLCNVAGEPDCLTAADPNTHYIYPGQTIPLSVAVVGQDFGTIAGPVLNLHSLWRRLHLLPLWN